MGCGASNGVQYMAAGATPEKSAVDAAKKVVEDAAKAKKELEECYAVVKTLSKYKIALATASNPFTPITVRDGKIFQCDDKGELRVDEEGMPIGDALLYLTSMAYVSLFCAMVTGKETMITEDHVVKDPRIRCLSVSEHSKEVVQVGGQWIFDVGANTYAGLDKDGVALRSMKEWAGRNSAKVRQSMAGIDLSQLKDAFDEKQYEHVLKSGPRGARLVRTGTFFEYTEGQ